MRRPLLFACIVGALVVCASAAPASAEFSVCNASSHATVNVAYAATWNDSDGNPHGQSQGWFKIDKGKCTIIITTLDVSGYSLYIYAFENSDSDKEYWDGTDANICVNPNDKFLYQGNAMLAPCAAGKSDGMRQLTTGGVTPYTYYLRD